MSPVIALVDDDRNILTSVSIALQAEGFVTRVYSDAATALKAFADSEPDLGVFDIKMPQMDGMELLRRVREKGGALGAMPVIFLTSKDDELDEALGLAMGADDYIAKPFSQRLLIARIRAILRRQELSRGAAEEGSAGAEVELIERGDLAMDPARHKVTWKTLPVTLTVTEFIILEALVQRPGVVKSRNQLLDIAYSDDTYVDDRTIDSHIKRIRRKFRAVDSEFDSIETLYGVGYRFGSDADEPRLPFRGRHTLATRLLATNLLTLALVAFGVLGLDQFRDKLLQERLERATTQALFAAEAISDDPAAAQIPNLARIGRVTGSRLRLYDPAGNLKIDSWTTTGPTFVLRDPNSQPWTKDAARLLDRGFNALTRDGFLPPLSSPLHDVRDSWPEARAAVATRRPQRMVREAPDLTPIITAAAPLEDGSVVLVMQNDRNFTRQIRSERASLGLAMLIATLLSIGLSLFLARTIVGPLRRIARAAHRVRLGRAREVRVPRLPSRMDEIGMLARAVSDMSQSLRTRIDNIEAFAADVTHELKNPLASLRSAVDGLERVDDPKLRDQLLDVVRQDVLRLDRLIGDISEAARTDAELARARFERVDLGELIGQLVGAWEQRRVTGNVRIAFARPRLDSTAVMGDPNRLARAIDNLIDNAISFSPSGGLVEVVAARVGDDVRIRIDDEGPGVPPAQREAIFNRFHSVRPEAEQFGRHSGLGLAIARAIVEGHDGEIDVADRDDAPSGARFTIRLPAAERSE